MGEILGVEGDVQVEPEVEIEQPDASYCPPLPPPHGPLPPPAFAYNLPKNSTEFENAQLPPPRYSNSQWMIQAEKDK